MARKAIYVQCGNCGKNWTDNYNPGDSSDESGAVWGIMQSLVKHSRSCPGDYTVAVREYVVPLVDD